MYELTREDPEDRWEVEALYDLCFAPGREALSSYRLRDGVPPVRDLCIVARDDLGIVGGAIRFWPVRVGVAEALLLGPVAVHPTRQGEGLGGALIREGIARAEADNWPRVILVGDAPYYGPFGFQQVPLGRITLPGPVDPARLLVALLNAAEMPEGAVHGGQ